MVGSEVGLGRRLGRFQEANTGWVARLMRIPSSAQWKHQLALSLPTWQLHSSSLTLLFDIALRSYS
jgi:hypothetical protein